jgi:hypothetical protein
MTSSARDRSSMDARSQPRERSWSRATTFPHDPGSLKQLAFPAESVGKPGRPRGQARAPGSREPSRQVGVSALSGFDPLAQPPAHAPHRRRDTTSPRSADQSQKWSSRGVPLEPLGYSFKVIPWAAAEKLGPLPTARGTPRSAPIPHMARFPTDNYSTRQPRRANRDRIPSHPERFRRRNG